MTNMLLILFPTQLFENKHIDNIFKANKSNNHIIIIEHPYFFTKYPYHKMKLVLHRASMMNYYDLINKKYHTQYIQYNEMNKIQSYVRDNHIGKIIFFNPIENELIDFTNSKLIKGVDVKKVDIEILPTPYFLNSYQDNVKINDELGGLRHDLFYKNQRIMHDIMVKKNNNKYIPDGNKWSFDTENRKPFEKTQNEPNMLKYKSKTRNEYLEEAVEYVNDSFSKHYGDNNLDNFIYPINRKEALKWLKHFVSNKLDNFGKYEDALSSQIKFGYHSLLSPLTNIGLITPNDIIDSVKSYKKNIASKEGFIRQVIGWREYCYFTYCLYSEKLAKTPLYGKNKNKIPKYVWNCSTQILPIDNILRNLSSNGYSHHIERLMGIGNFLVLIETDPKEIYNWFQTMYIDAYDVFMIPNIYGMLCYGKLTDKYHMMTRPYFASSNYIMKMSDYKSKECVKIKNEVYKWDDILDCLYWEHINKYSKEFKKIYATSSAVSRYEKFDSDKKKYIQKISKKYIDWIHS